MPRIRVAACQINTVVGDLAGNVDRAIDALRTASDAGADLAVFPELTVTGYPPEDLLGRPAFVADNLAAFEAVVAGTGDCAAVLGYVDIAPSCRLLNAAAMCRDGRVLGRYVKRILPNYGVFDEQRWFAAGTGRAPRFEIAGVPVGITVCEDMWFPDGPMAEQAADGARLLVNLNASPYSRGRREQRLAVLADRAAETGCAVVYVNQVGGQDELVFDGASLVVNAGGKVVASARQFAEEVMVADLDIGAAAPSTVMAPDRILVSAVSRAPDDARRLPVADVLDPVAEVYEALVHGVAMPSRYSSGGSVTDAEALATNLGIDLAGVSIEPAHHAFSEMLTPLLGAEPSGLTDENLQSRIRGVLLMALSNAHGWIVLTTGNKSEMATGYSTLYGDSAGGFAVIKDVAKTLVYEMCRHRNARAGFDLIPDPVLTKAPSAELRPDQRDDESLPPYSVLDPVMAGYVEGDRSADDLIAEGYDPDVVAQVIGLVDRAEYKRRQMPPGVRISAKAFGKDRRMPITNHYRSATARPDTGPGTPGGEAPAPCRAWPSR